MSRALVISLVAATIAACAGGDPPVPGPKAGSPDGPPVLTDDDWSVIRTLSPMPDLPPDPTNAYADDPRAAALGQKLFFAPIGTNFGSSSNVSCATCHAGPALDDRRAQNAVSLGVAWGSRNALPIVNSAYYAWSGWGGRFDTQWSLVLGATENAKVLATSRLAIAHFLFTSYRDEYDAIFPVPLDPDLAGTTRFPLSGAPGSASWSTLPLLDQMIVDRIFVNYGKAIAAYMRRLVTKNAPFDRWVAGDARAISDSAARGLKVFIENGCVSCHRGPRFTDDDFHWDGTQQLGEHVPPIDNGRADDVSALLASEFTAGSAWSDAPETSRITSLRHTQIPRSMFRTKSLRDVGTSAPYMHCGQFASLEAVVDHYCGEGGASAEPPPPPTASSSDTGGGYGGSSSPPPPTPAALPDPPPAHFVALTPAERTDLVAFLKTLDGEPVDPDLLKAEGP